MSDKIVSISLDVTLIDKARLVPGKKPNKAGKIPQYLNLDLVLRKDGADQFGNNYFVTQKISKEGREAGNKAEIIGNGKTIIGPDGPRSGGRPTPTNRPAPAKAADASDDSSVPF